MGHHSCTCCCAHDNAQPKNTPGNTGFLKEYPAFSPSAFWRNSHESNEYKLLLGQYRRTCLVSAGISARRVTRTERGMGKYSAERCFQ